MSIGSTSILTDGCTEQIDNLFSLARMLGFRASLQAGRVTLVLPNMVRWMTSRPDFVACSLGSISAILVLSANLLPWELRYVVVVSEISSMILLVKYFYLYAAKG